MGQESVILRPGRATFEEGLACGRYLDQAAEGFFRILLGKEASSIIARAYLEPNHSYSFENVTFAEDGERLVGMALGYTADAKRKFSDAPIERAAGRRRFRMNALKTLATPMLRVLNVVPDGYFYLLALAVDEDARGQGVGSLLMGHVEDHAREVGAEKLALDVAATNVGARRLYERRGMVIESRWPMSVRLPTLRFVRLA